MVLPARANTTHTAPENRVFFPALDGLRAIAFLLVFMQHYLSLPWGWSGVNIFFVLSGFLITGILFDSRDDPHRLRNFYVRRTLRIFPLYYGILFALLLVYPVFRWHWSASWLAWPLYLGNFLRFRSSQTIQRGSVQELAGDAHLGSLRLPHTELYLGHLWSLCVEEQFYLLWPSFVFLFRSRRALLWICGLAVVIVPVVRVITQQRAPVWMLSNELLYRATPFQLDALLLGGFIALLWRGPHREWLFTAARAVAIVATLCTIGYLTFSLHMEQPHWAANYVYPAWRLTWGLSFINVFSAAIIVCCLRPGNWIYSILHIQALRWIGRISYGAYVLHDVIHGLYTHVFAHLAEHSAFVANNERTLTALLAFPATLFLAWLSFRFFESPFLNLKERWTIRSKPSISKLP